MTTCLLLTVWFFLCISGSVYRIRAQNQTVATTHPDEARALNSIFAAWRIRAPREWNISGELCSGAATDERITMEDKNHNPLIKCDCYFENSTICRITALKVFAKDVSGPIPPLLWTLTYLTDLNLAQNYLTGSLSPAIGNLTQLEWLAIGINALSGPFPKEIGLLTNLKSLGIGLNNFTGPIPAEIGNCTRLLKIYLGNSGLGGEIPSSFANLIEMQEACINDVDVTGRIPEFIGTWTKLLILKLHGTGLSGPLPSSFSNLTSLTDLSVGDISNGGSSLEFIKGMKSLNILTFRNSNLTGTIPSNIGEYSKLKHVDLSFNKLHGPIPASLFNISGLTYLFLGNNTFNGSLPTQKSQTLSNIDVSYNDLSGSLPSWVSLPNLKLVLPGLKCLQKNFPCNRGKGIYSDFWINCGGPQIAAVSGEVFEREDEDLGAASFVVSDVQRWAATSVGAFSRSISNIWVVNTLDSDLFRSARQSSSSLRYYGLGLENGVYTVTLQFAEIQIIGSNTWKGLGRRIFDIYVQGRLVEKDFNIRRIVGGDATVGGVQRDYQANVSENYLEIHLLWAGKGSIGIPVMGTYGPLVSAVSAKPDFIPTVANRPPSKKKYKTGTVVGAGLGLGLLSIFFAGVVTFIIRKSKKRYTVDKELLSMEIKPYTFTYSELKSATQDFNTSNKLGEGGFGSVYKGTLSDGREIAVKVLSVGSQHGKGQFVAEIVTISTVLHRNLVKLYGCCYEGDHRLLVYEYLPNGSLDHALFGGEKTLHLDWSTRFEICLGVARGLAYLHEEASDRIVHRDVKASNILLDSKLLPKVSDFGLAKLYDDSNTHMSTKVAGTIGYLSPEYAMRGQLSEKTDVYAFGVVVLELVSGRKNYDTNLDDEKKYLLDWAWNQHEQSREGDLIDHRLTEFNMEEAKRMIGIALLCIQASYGLRPPMSRVVAMLSGDVEVSDVTSKPGYLTDWTFDETSSSSFGTFQTKDTTASSSSSTMFVTPREADTARALNSIFAAWRIRAPREWNISGELCSGAAIDERITIDDKNHNPFIKCDCNFENSTICHITALKVFQKDVVGAIPPQLWTLTYLINLNLAQNYLTGSIPPAIGYLTRMEWLTFGINALSGPFPKEIGLLTELKSLGIGVNNFSGSIPAEIGNCTKLMKIYLGVSGLSGEIPLSFANLVELQEAYITDMDITGRIPKFIGTWTKLTILKIVGTGLSGPIPSSFSNLTSLKELVFRNSNLTGTIASNIGEYSSLQQVDLSFNKLHGPIPASLFNLNQLTHLFLGNNTFNGSLPTQKSQALTNIDVSYNNLSGNLPSWVSLPNLKLNLVVNNFTLEGLDKRVLPGLKCLQKNFPCNRGKGIYSDFSINCGGPQIRSVSGEVFERDDKDLGQASFVVSDIERWAVSSVGLFSGSSNNIWVINALDSELFRSARHSSSSLRYYGLGLENGGYTITLQFAEILIFGSKTWRSLGRRLFDIYVQGRLVEKDFDIRRTAGDTAVRAVRREYKANVSENYIEIHLFWAGKGSFSVPVIGTFGPLISAVTAKPDFTPTVTNRPPSKKKNRTGIIVGVTTSIGLLSIFFAGVIIFIIRKSKKRYTNDEELLFMDVKPYTFAYSELKSATQDFDPSNKLGEGGFGPVYKGTLSDGREIAVKELSVGSRQGKGQFVAEIVTISTVLHRNLVKLYGCCYEGDHRLLVYEYLPNGSLDHALFGHGGEKTLHLDWSTRFEICMGVARGLAYLHEEASVCIVHRDVKASNILLDSKLLPKVSDFGLAKLYDDKKTHISTRVAGTIGYLAPEYAMRGYLTEKTDVYAFGVVVLELVSGRPNSDVSLNDEKKFLLEWAWNLHEKNSEIELIDPDLTEINMDEVQRMIGIALLCIQSSYGLRPPMSRVVAMLSGDIEVTDATSKPGYLTDWRINDTSSSSFSAFQATDTSTSWASSTRFVTPKDSDFKPMLGLKINEGR
ncbi:hypothetical protein CARUB_v10008071mg [Capsella rubella]|uniref:non-specific serine/threonine protein kinase n=1 Tax=Capsella rubella TaxID=81985 RepID=R0IAP3_9BRAS|nr:hypothetical protein CARUB_v10008071mg [Capsella rubella]